MRMRWLARGVLVMTVATVVGVLGFSVIGAKRADALSGAPVTTFAVQAPVDSGGGGGSDDCGKPRLLGVFVPWYEYLNIAKDDTGSCAVEEFTLLPKNKQSSDVPLVVVAIVDDLLRLAGLIAVIFVIYGGVQYATSQGNPDAASKAQSTILNALIGLAVAMVAVAFVTYLGRTLG